MRGAVLVGYGGPEVLQVGEVDSPEVGPGRVLIKVASSSVNPIDWKLRKGAIRYIYPLQLPCVLGFDVSGTVESVGEGVTDFAVGDEVYTRLPTGETGAYAELCVAPADRLALKPKSMSFAEAAAVPLAALTALQAMRDLGGLTSGSRVLVNGASGGVGHYAVQIAKAMGATVTGVSSARNHELVLGLGADEVIDYKSEDFTDRVGAFDLVFDAVANRSPWQCRRCLDGKGSYVTTSPSLSYFSAVPFWVFMRQKVAFIRVKPNAKDLDQLTEWVEAGQLRSVIDSTFPLAQINQAHERSQTGRVVGKIVIEI